MWFLSINRPAELLFCSILESNKTFYNLNNTFSEFYYNLYFQLRPDQLYEIISLYYNIRIHYEQNHPNNDLPEIYLSKNDEVEKLKALEFK